MTLTVTIKHRLTECYGKERSDEIVKSLAGYIETEQAMIVLNQLMVARARLPLDTLSDMVVATSRMKNKQKADLLIAAFGFEGAKLLGPIFLKDKMYFQRVRREGV